MLADKRRRSDAITALATISQGAVPWLAKCLDADQPDVRRGVVEALGRMSHPSASAHLERALDDGDANVRRRAVASLARLGTRGVAQRLAAMARTDAAPSVREAAARAISGRDALQ
jgi:HEAT repeat protein